MSKLISQEVEALLKSTKDDTLKSVLFNLKLVPTFSLIIEATYQPIRQFLSGEFPTLSQDDITAICVAASCQFIFKSYERIKHGKELKEYLKSRDLETKIVATKDKLTKLLKIGADVLKDMGYTVGTMSGILGFAFILHPLMDGLSELMGRNSDFTIDNMFNYVALGAAFKGSLFLEQLINKITKSYEKEPKIVKKENWPNEFNQGDTTYILHRKSSDRATYVNKEYKDDKLTFGNVSQMEEFLDDYTEPKGGTQSTQLGDEYLSESELKRIIRGVIL